MQAKLGASAVVSRVDFAEKSWKEQVGLTAAQHHETCHYLALALGSLFRCHRVSLSFCGNRAPIMHLTAALSWKAMSRLIF